MMREDIVNAAGVYVELLAEVLDRHCRALDVPAGEALTPGAVPLEVSSRLRPFPQGEVALVALQGVRLDPYSLQKLPLILVSRELSVARELRDLVVDVSLDFEGVPLLDQSLHYVHHLLNVVRCLGQVLRTDNVELPLIFKKALRVELGYLSRGLALGYGGRYDLVLSALQHLLAHVANVGDVFHVGDLEVLHLENAANPVGHQV